MSGPAGGAPGSRKPMEPCAPRASSHGRVVGQQGFEPWSEQAAVASTAPHRRPVASCLAECRPWTVSGAARRAPLKAGTRRAAGLSPCSASSLWAYRYPHQRFTPSGDVTIRRRRQCRRGARPRWRRWPRTPPPGHGRTPPRRRRPHRAARSRSWRTGSTPYGAHRASGPPDMRRGPDQDGIPGPHVGRRPCRQLQRGDGPEVPRAEPPGRHGPQQPPHGAAAIKVERMGRGSACRWRAGRRRWRRGSTGLRLVPCSRGPARRASRRRRWRRGRCLCGQGRGGARSTVAPHYGPGTGRALRRSFAALSGGAGAASGVPALWLAAHGLSHRLHDGLGGGHGPRACAAETSAAPG